MSLRTRHWYRFGSYRLDATDHLLYKDDQVVAIPPKVFDTLHLLVANHGHVLSKGELLKQLWPDTFVEDHSLAQYISLVRRALGEEASWVENLPRRGYRFTGPVQEFRDDAAADRPVDRGPPPATTPRPKFRMAALVAAVILIALGWVWSYFSRGSQIQSIAVLPFLNLGGDSKFDYISDGLSDELTHAVTRLEGIRVAARSSAFQFRGKNQDVRKLGQILKVDGVLEGSVRFESDGMRVVARCVDTRTGYHVWSEIYEGRLDDLARIQEQISVSLARRLGRQVRAPVESSSALRREVIFPYLEGRYFLAKGRPETFGKAAEAFQKAISLDPKHARAYAGLADTYYRWALWESFPPGEAFAAARRAAEQALALDESLAEAHASLANVKFQYDWDFATAEREFRRSISLDQNRADTWHWFSHFLTARGRFAESLEASKKAIELEPFDLPSQNHLGWCYYFEGDYDRAIQQHRKVLELDPAHGQTRLLLGRALVQRGRYDEAIAQLRKNLELSPDSPERLAGIAQAYAISGARHDANEILHRLLRLSKQRYVAAYSIAMVYAALGAKEEALAYLEKATVERSSRIIELKYEPIFQALRSEPSFRAVLQRVGL